MKTLCFMIMFFLSAGFSYGAAYVTINPNKLSTEDAQKLIALQKRAENTGNIAIPTSPEEVERWSNIGQAVAKSIGAACKELSVGVNDFVNTPVGKMTMFLILWHILIKDLIGLGVAILIWIVVLIAIIWSYRKNHTTERIEDKAGNVTYIERRQWESGDAKLGSAIAHWISMLAITIMLVIVAMSI